MASTHCSLQTDDTKSAGRNLVWVPDQEQGYVQACVVSRTPVSDEVTVQLLDTGQSVTVMLEDIQRVNPPKFDRIENMAELTCLNEASVLHNLKQRYSADLIYTYSGLFCVVINPYKALPIYSEHQMTVYRGKPRHEVPPHIFAVADSAYRKMMDDKENQSILCTGESGAGKTENTKKIIQYLLNIASSHKSDFETGQNTDLIRRLLKTSAVLEAFGNAKTVRNDNSSRFGKFIRVYFEPNGKITGASVETHLLEKSRVVRQPLNECSFHVFYQLLRYASGEIKSECFLEEATCYSYLTHGNVSRADRNDCDQYQQMLGALQLIGLDEENVLNIHKTLSIVLLLGNMDIREDATSDQAVLPDNSVALKVSRLAGVPVKDLIRAFLKPNMRLASENVIRSQSKDQVVFAVESISRTLYERAFKWIVQQINRSICCIDRPSNLFNGILDIAGFEILQVNSFEQLCINYTNEKLQQLFNHTMFVMEQQEYQSEGIEWNFIDFELDLQPTIDLIEKPTGGILALIDDECRFPKATDKTLVEKLVTQLSGHCKFIRPDFTKTEFTLVHYAGKVRYCCDQWLSKNMDPQNETVISLLQKSNNEFMRSLWKDANVSYSLPSAVIAGGDTGPRVTRGGMFRTVGHTYRDQLSKLMSILQGTRPSFVRCLLPNRNKLPGQIDALLVLDQLRCNGVLEGIRICHYGYPNRILIGEFRQRYGILTPQTIRALDSDTNRKQFCLRMMSELCLVPNLFRIGRSKVFFRAGVVAALELARETKLTSLVTVFQAYCRGILARRFNCKSFSKAEKTSYILQFITTAQALEIRPLMTVTLADEKIERSARELSQANHELEKLKRAHCMLAKENRQLQVDICLLQAEISSEKQHADSLEEMCMKLTGEKEVLEKFMHDARQQKSDLDEQVKISTANQQRLKQTVEDLEDQLEHEERKRQKLQIEKAINDAKLQNYETLACSHQASIDKLAEENKQLHDGIIEMTTKFNSKPQIAKHDDLSEEQKLKYESRIKDLQAALSNQQHEYESEIACLNAEVKMYKSQADNKLDQIETLKTELNNRSEQHQLALERISAEQLEKSSLIKLIQQLKAEQQQLEETVDVERITRVNAEDRNRELDKEVAELKAELGSTRNHTTRQLNEKYETEIAEWNRKLVNVEEVFKIRLQEFQSKGAYRMEQLNVQINELTELQSARQQTLVLEMDKSRLTMELAESRASSAEARKRCQQITEEFRQRTILLEGLNLEREKMQTKLSELQETIDSTSDQLGLAEKRCSDLVTEYTLLSAELENVNQRLASEKRSSLAANEQLHSVKFELESLKRWVSEHDHVKLERQLANQTQQLAKCKLDNDQLGSMVKELIEERVKFGVERDSFEKQIESLKADNSRLQSAKKAVSLQVEDLTVELNKQLTEMRTYQIQTQHFDSCLERQRITKKHMQDEIETLKQQCHDNDATVDCLEHQVAHLQSSLTVAEQWIETLKLEIEHSLLTKDDVVVKMLISERENQLLKGEIAELLASRECLEKELHLKTVQYQQHDVNLQAFVEKTKHKLKEVENHYTTAIAVKSDEVIELTGKLAREQRSKEILLTEYTKLEASVNAMQRYIVYARETKDDCMKSLRKVKKYLEEYESERLADRMSAKLKMDMIKAHEQRTEECQCSLISLSVSLASAEEKCHQYEEVSSQLLQVVRNKWRDEQGLLGRIMVLERRLQEERRSIVTYMNNSHSNQGQLLVERLDRERDAVGRSVSQTSAEDECVPIAPDDRFDIATNDVTSNTTGLTAWIRQSDRENIRSIDVDELNKDFGVVEIQQ